MQGSCPRQGNAVCVPKEVSALVALCLPGRRAERLMHKPEFPQLIFVRSGALVIGWKCGWKIASRDHTACSRVHCLLHGGETADTNDAKAMAAPGPKKPANR